MWVRRDQLQVELTRYNLLSNFGDKHATEVQKIVQAELDIIGETLRLAWSSKMTWDRLNEDQRGCIQRSLWVRKDGLQQELRVNEAGEMEMDQHARDTVRIVRVELNNISSILRTLWTVHDGRSTKRNRTG